MHHEYIPDELKALPQWCCASDGRFGKAGMPLNPVTGMAADPTDPSTWASFEYTLDIARRMNLPIGLMLTRADPYTIIDLDNKEHNPATPDEMARYLKMIETYDSYTELSNSGRGYHIIVRGDIGAGRRRDKIEVYSNDRFMICTGNSFHRDEPKPIADRQELLNMLLSQMPSAAASIELDDVDDPFSDSHLVELLMYARNGDKFNRLCRGEWENELNEFTGRVYESQSDADHALLALLAFQTPSNEQVRRVFRMTALGKREKAQRDNYLNYSLSKIRARHIEMGHSHERLDLDAINAAASVPVPPQPTPTPAPVPVQPAASPIQGTIPLPPGLVGELAQYIYSTSIRPVPEISLCAALGLVAGIVGRNFNTPKRSGLNLYIALLARTGRGKEAMAMGINQMTDAVQASIPTVNEFIGPARFSSGPALIKALEDRPAFVSVLGEFGLFMQELRDPKNPTSKHLKGALLDIYGKSGTGGKVLSSVYSDREKNTRTIYSPALTLLGESTPEEFFAALDESQVVNGLVGRMVYVLYDGPRTPENPGAGAPPSPLLVDKFAKLLETVLRMRQNNSVATVGYDQGAQTILDTFSNECDARINAANDAVTEGIWNRAALNVQRIACVLAIGVNHHNPMVSTVEAQWAVDMVNRSCRMILARFEEGSVGASDATAPERAVRKSFENYWSLPVDKRKGTYGVADAIVYQPGIVPYTYLRRVLQSKQPFKEEQGHRRVQAIKGALKDLCDAGVIQQVPPEQLFKEFAHRSECYIKGTSW